MALSLGFFFSRGVKSINHSLFVDDTLFLRGASCIVARRFKNILDRFLEVSGCLLNSLESSIYGWNTPLIILQRVSQILGVPFKANSGHFKHLALPISKDILKSQIWHPSIKKTKKQIQNWGMLWLNLAGRITLIKFVLSTLPLYQFAIIQDLVGVQNQIDLIIKEFLWQGGKLETKKFSLVNWKQVTAPFENGGISICLHGLMNITFRPKIIWRFIT